MEKQEVVEKGKIGRRAEAEGFERGGGEKERWKKEREKDRRLWKMGGTEKMKALEEGLGIGELEDK